MFFVPFIVSAVKMARKLHFSYHFPRNAWRVVSFRSQTLFLVFLSTKIILLNFFSFPSRRPIPLSQASSTSPQVPRACLLPRNLFLPSSPSPPLPSVFLHDSLSFCRSFPLSQLPFASSFHLCFLYSSFFVYKLTVTSTDKVLQGQSVGDLQVIRGWKFWFSLCHFCAR